MQSNSASGRASVPVHGAPGRVSGRASVPPSPPVGPGPGRSYGGRAGGHPPGSRPALVARRRPRWRKVLLVSLLSLLLVAGLGTVALLFYSRGLDSNMDRIDAFGPLNPAERPQKLATGSLNILMLGSDSRDPEAPGGDRADTIMLMHIPSAQDQAFLISIPRDLWVYVPPNVDGTAGGREAKINAATAFGGVPLAVQTVEHYTGVHIDHVIKLDFGGFVEVTDALGGVEMDIEQTIQSIHRPRRTFEAGRQHLNGEEALDYVRQRYQFADGDFTRMRNQQQFLRALMDKATSRETMTNPARLHGFLQAMTSTVTVDNELSLLNVAWKFRQLRSDNLTFMTTPHAGTGMIGGESVVLSDDAAAAELFTAVREDRITDWVQANPDRAGGGD